MSRLLYLPLSKTFFIIFIACVLWVAAGIIIRKFSEKRNFSRFEMIWKILNIAALICVSMVILHFTVFNRTPTGVHRLALRPYDTIRMAIHYGEYRREKLLNVFAYIPVGVTSSCIFEKKKRSMPAAAVSIGFILSVVSECAQYFGTLGLAETDDVIANTAGTAIGVLIYVMCVKIFLALSNFNAKKNDAKK